jgi:hypothetical protein
LHFPGCRETHEEVRNPEKEVFNFTVTEAQREFINKSRGDSFEVANPVPVLQFAGRTYTIDRFEIRGESSLNFERKGFGVNMGNKLTLTNPFEKTERRNSNWLPWYSIIPTLTTVLLPLCSGRSACGLFTVFLQKLN